MPTKGIQSAFAKQCRHIRIQHKECELPPMARDANREVSRAAHFTQANIPELGARTCRTSLSARGALAFEKFVAITQPVKTRTGLAAAPAPKTITLSAPMTIN